MKIIALAFLAFSFNLTDGKLSRVSKGRLLTPEEVGAYHTDAFDLLGEKYSKEKPNTLHDVISDVGDILANYCPEDDDACKKHAYISAKYEFKRELDGSPRSIYPQEFDNKLKNPINRLVTYVENIDELNLDTVLLSLNDIKQEIEDMTGIDEGQKKASLIGVSVAIESTKLWHATHYDTAHPLHDMINHFDPEQSHRRLQMGFPIAQLPAILGVIEDCGIDPAIILADFAAAMNIGVPAIQTNFENVTGVTDIGFADVLFLMPIVSASAAAFFNSGGYYYYDYDDDYFKAVDEDCWASAFQTLGICL